MVRKQLSPVAKDRVHLSSDLTSTQGVARLVNSAKIILLKMPEWVVAPSRHEDRISYTGIVGSFGILHMNHLRAGKRESVKET
jgi:RNA:NAD 2'-phosphotransferase (TPT1/KptA family)